MAADRMRHGLSDTLPQRTFLKIAVGLATALVVAAEASILWYTSVDSISTEPGEDPLDSSTCWSRDERRKRSVFSKYESTLTQVSLATIALTGTTLAIYVGFVAMMKCDATTSGLVRHSGDDSSIAYTAGHRRQGGFPSWFAVQIKTLQSKGKGAPSIWSVLQRLRQGNLSAVDLACVKLSCVHLLSAVVLLSPVALWTLPALMVVPPDLSCRGSDDTAVRPCVLDVTLARAVCDSLDQHCFPASYPALTCRSPIMTCNSTDLASPLPEERSAAQAASFFCNAGLQDLVPFCVSARFEAVDAMWRNEDGWIEEAFVTYVGLGRSEQTDWLSMTDLLAQSTHHFSSRPIVVAYFGSRVPAEWTPERFPNMILLHGEKMLPSQSFNFNKLRALLFTKVKVGIVVDADQWVNRGIDVLFRRAAEETTAEYPYPIMPVHWLSRDPEAMNYRGSYLFQWRPSETSPPTRSMRWGQAHPTFTYHAFPFVAKWTAYVLAPERSNSPEWLKAQGKIEDEDLLNIASWAEGITKQWCKFDILGPVSFLNYMEQSRKKSKVAQFSDKKWFPCGIPMVYYTAHATKKLNQSAAVLRKLWDMEQLPLINYRSRWFSSAEMLMGFDDTLNCLV